MDLYVQDSGLQSGTTVVNATLNGVVAGATLVAILGDGSKSAPATFTVTDAQGSYTVQPTPYIDASNAVRVNAFVLTAANAGTHTIAGTGDVGDNMVALLIELGPGAVAGEIAQLNLAPGTGADAITSTAVGGVTGAATLIGFCSTTNDVSHIADAGSGFTSRGSGTGASIGAWRFETKAISTNVAATFTATAGNGGDSYGALAIAILNNGSLSLAITPAHLVLTGRNITVAAPPYPPVGVTPDFSQFPKNPIRNAAQGYQ